MSGTNPRQHSMVDTLLREMSANERSEFEGPSPQTANASHGDDPTEVLRSVMERLGVEESFAFDEEMVKQNLDEILMAILAMRNGAHGKALIDDLSRSFDAELSPGTVYPRLHDLRDENTLVMHELVQTKEYSVDETTDAQTQIERAINHHLSLGLFLREALDEL